MLDALAELATPVGIVIRWIHAGLSTFLDPASGLAWGLSIILLTVTVRLVLFPLFVKQIKSQRRMQQIAPMVKELQKKHKGDRESLNTELMKLYKENNANPISGCLPLLLQLPVFFALFTVIRQFGPDKEPAYGLSSELLEQGGLAKVLGAPIAAAFNSPADVLAELDGSASTVRIVAALMVVGMGATTYWTQRQMIARAGTTDPQQIMVQKFLLYVLPLSFAVSGVFFPIGVLLYWLTTNVWSMGQQAYVIKRMPPPVVPGSAAAKAATKAAEAKADKKAAAKAQPAGGAAAASADGGRTAATSGSGAATAVVDADGAVGSAGSRASGGAKTKPSGSGARPSTASPKGGAAGRRKHKNRRGGRR